MKVYSGTSTSNEISGPHAIAIGVFDGVHQGHRALLDRARAEAANDNIQSLVYTFHPHPARTLRPELAPRLIEKLGLRLERFDRLGMDGVWVEDFNEEFAEISAQDFVREILVKKLGAKHLIIGAGFNFGKNQEGNIALLEKLGVELGFKVHPVPAQRVDGIIASSTKIRQFVSNGQIEGANLLLTRPVCVRGVAVHGDHRGSTLGFATANLQVENELVPARGVYATRTRGKFGVYDSVTNIGLNPTFGGNAVLKVETHLLGYEGGSLYHNMMSVEFLARLREEKRFDNKDELIEQIKIDVENARKIHKQNDKTPSSTP
ncbi:bifunctional riboflavin kinase/FAD synthetase [Myxococcota bacterium]|nr:bifunctional riboflavin kinase/FAD synthetase [Myxococcota bacterium]